MRGWRRSTNLVTPRLMVLVAQFNLELVRRIGIDFYPALEFALPELSTLATTSSSSLKMSIFVAELASFSRPAIF